MYTDDSVTTFGYAFYLSWKLRRTIFYLIYEANLRDKIHHLLKCVLLDAMLPNELENRLGYYSFSEKYLHTSTPLSARRLSSEVETCAI